MKDFVLYEYDDQDADENVRLHPYDAEEAMEASEEHNLQIYPVAEITLMSETSVLLDVDDCIRLAEKLLRFARKAGE